MNLQSWVGRTETLEDIATATPVAALSATLDRPHTRPAPGTALPPIWHWLYFLPLAPQSELGEDGHPRRGGFLPPVALPRRMWAGSQLAFHEALRVGDAITRTSTILSIEEKSGRSGQLVFVRVGHEIRRNGAPDVALSETHDIVYREAARPGDPTPPARPAPDDAAWETRWHPDDPLLFRYSALTFNSHRIHYDRRYVTEVEGYPGLIVHGPLLATLLLDALRHQMPDAQVATFSFRAMKPVFDTHDFFVCGAPQTDAPVPGKTFRLWVKDHEGAMNMDATATLR